ncbi:MAG: hypothetical protein ACRETY_06345 [Steroidobacteraceae bacterium]
MSGRVVLPAAVAAAGLLVISLPRSADAQQAITIDSSDLGNCIGQPTCVVEGVELSASVGAGGGTIATKTLLGATGFGVSGGGAGGEIAIDETLHVDAGAARNILEIKFLFLFNGPEFGDPAEKAQVIADGMLYTLSTSSSADNFAVWSGPGTVTSCGPTTSSGTGCFKVANPFPDAVSQLDFTAIAGGASFGGGPVTNNSDYSIGSIKIEDQIVIDLEECAGTEGCVVTQGFSLNSLNASNPGGSTDALVIPVILPDCRYIPLASACLDLLPAPVPATADAARAALINAGVIKSLDPTGPNKLHPATQLLNVTKLFSTDITSQFDTSGMPPDGLPPLWIDSRWKAQLAKGHLIHGFFFKTDAGILFTDVFEGLIDVSELTGDELGCFPDPDDLLAWDVIATGSEVARSIAGRHVDTIINTGCVNPTKVKGTRLSLYSILEMTRDTYGPTIKSSKPLVTVNNDAVFARLVETLWKDLGEVRANYACKQADPTPSGGQAPLSAALCNTLAARWSDANKKIKDCVVKTFKPITGAALGICEKARDELVVAFETALPATTTGPDPFNRLGELRGRVEAFKHIWDTRFLPSLDLAGFCRERGTCAP